MKCRDTIRYFEKPILISDGIKTGSLKALDGVYLALLKSIVTFEHI